MSTTLVPVTQLVTDSLFDLAHAREYDSTSRCTIAYGMGVLDAGSMRKRAPRSILLFIAAVELGTQMNPDFEEARILIDDPRYDQDDADEMILEAYATGWERAL